MAAATGLTFNPPNLAINKLHGASKFTVMLEKKPTGDATVTFKEDSKVTFSACSFTFTEANWNVPQEVEVYPQSGIQCNKATITASVCAPNTAELNGKTQNYEIDAPCDSDEAECSSTGDPHIKTFAGTNYNLYPTGAYYLFKNDLLSIQADHYECRKGAASCANAIAIRYGTSSIVVSVVDKKMVLVKGSAQVDVAEIDYKIDGDIYKINLGDGSRILLTGTSSRIDTTIKLAKSYYGESSGLCSVCKQGVKDLVAKDVANNATPTKNLSKFTDSWKVEAADNMFDGKYVVPEIYKKTYAICKAVTECSPHIAPTTAVPTTTAVAISSVLPSSVVATSVAVVATSVVPTTPVVTTSVPYETPKRVYKECPSYSGKPSTPAVKEFPKIDIKDAKALCESLVKNNGCKTYVDYEEHLNECAEDVAATGNKMDAEGYRQTYNARCYESIQDTTRNTSAPIDVTKALTECGFTGEKSCPNDCGGATNGYCSKSACQCLPGYGGEDCSTVLDEAEALESTEKVLSSSAIRTGPAVSMLVFILSILYI